MPPDGEKNSVVNPLSIKKIVLLNKIFHIECSLSVYGVYQMGEV